MYKIINQTDGATIATTEKIRYIKQSRAGAFVSCTEAEAQGVAYNNKAYNLAGRENMSGCDISVIVVEIDSGAELAAHNERQTALAALLVDVKYKQTLLDLGVSENA